MQQHGIDAVIALRASRGHVHRRLHQGRDLCLQLLQPAAVLPILCGGQCLQHFILMLRQAQRLVGMRIEPVQQCLRPIGTHPHALHHRHAQHGAELGHINHHTLSACHIAHIEHDQHGNAQCTCLQHQAQVEPQSGGIADTDEQLRRCFLGVLAGHHLTGNALVLAVCMQAVGARQIQQTNLPARCRLQPAFLALDGNASVVGHFLPHASQQVEQRCLAAVGAAQQSSSQSWQRVALGKTCSNHVYGLTRQKADFHQTHDHLLIAVICARPKTCNPCGLILLQLVQTQCCALPVRDCTLHDSPCSN